MFTASLLKPHRSLSQCLWSRYMDIAEMRFTSCYLGTTSHHKSTLPPRSKVLRKRTSWSISMLRLGSVYSFDILLESGKVHWWPTAPHIMINVSLAGNVIFVDVILGKCRANVKSTYIRYDTVWSGRPHSGVAVSNQFTLLPRLITWFLSVERS